MKMLISAMGLLLFTFWGGKGLRSIIKRGGRGRYASRREATFTLDLERGSFKQEKKGRQGSKKARAVA